LSGPSLDLIAPIRLLQLCADGGYQLRLGVLGVPLIMVPDTCGARVWENCNTPGVYRLLDNEYGVKHVRSMDKTDFKF
jgi:hypothetical protein